MKKLDFKAFIEGAREDFKIAVDDLFNAVEILREDVEELKKQKLDGK